MRAAVSALKHGPGLLIWLAVIPFVLPFAVEGREGGKAPEFPHQDPARWVGTPVRLEDLRGRVVLLDVWTFG